MARIPGWSAISAALSSLRVRASAVALVSASLMLGLGAQPALAQGGAATPATQPTTAAASILNGLPILKVEVNGNTRTNAQLILDQVRAQEGQIYSRDLIDIDVKAI